LRDFPAEGWLTATGAGGRKTAPSLTVDAFRDHDSSFQGLLSGYISWPQDGQRTLSANRCGLVIFTLAIKPQGQ